MNETESNRKKKKENETNIIERKEEEYIRIKSFFSEMSPEKQFILDSLIQSFAFYRVELAELERKILLNGVSEEYKNGNNQSGLKSTPEIKTQLQMQKNLQSATIKLLDILPTDKQTSFATYVQNINSLKESLSDDTDDETEDTIISETYEEWEKRNQQ